ncbi:MAG: NRDE family protein [Herminiimonas sp.]|nr:NRDE family protein [Herminiimonas sp.]
MCLIVFAWKLIPGAPLIAAANRDEFYDRPAAPASWWEDHPQVYAGRDLRGGGTWLGVSRAGRFAALTNIRAPSERRDGAPSRGALVADYLAGEDTPSEYVTRNKARTDDFNGFNLLIGDDHTMIWYSNRDHGDARNGQPLEPGIYGLSNDRLDAPWPKVVRTKAQFASMLCQGAPEDAYFDMLSDTTRASDCRLPKTGVSLEMERLLSAVCIESPTYGTRVSTVVQLRADKSVSLDERAIR